jgi:hypothetical protein
MRVSKLVYVTALGAALVSAAACYRNGEPPRDPVGSTRVTSADEASPSTDFQDPWVKDGGAHPYDSDYDNAPAGQSPGISPGSSYNPPVSRPVPWRGSSGGGSK